MKRLLQAGMLFSTLAWSADVYRFDLPAGFPAPRVPTDNPMSESKVRLGRRLFYDKQLSGNGTQSCASCHKQELAFTDGRATAVGSTGQAHPRSSMSLVNVAYNSAFTWSNPNLRTLEQQALVPMFSEHPVELGVNRKVVDVFRHDEIYCGLFAKAFPLEKDPFTIPNVAKALAAFERTILSARSPYDRYYYGGEGDAISDAAKRGEALFFSDVVAGCFRCHGGFHLSDATDHAGNASAPRPVFHNTALYVDYPAPNLGIYEYTKKVADIGKFRAPSLRNIALTAPYMHDGSIATLNEVLDHYAAGGRGHLNTRKDKRMTGIALTAQNRKDLLAFLESLTDMELLRDPRFSNPW